MSSTASRGAMVAWDRYGRTVRSAYGDMCGKNRLTAMIAPPDLALRSLDASWDRARWASLPPDGNRYEVIEGVLYVTTAPSFFHQWIIRQIFLTLFAQVDGARVGLTIWSPVG